MAAHSPIVLNSSSPHAFRSSSATPQSARQTGSGSVADSSSPQLADISTFLKRPSDTLKGGSRAQQLPNGAATGFSSAANLWRTQKVTETDSGGTEERSKTVQDGQGAVKQPLKPNKGAGKLVRPQKTGKATSTTKQERAGGRTPRTNSACDNLTVSAHFKGSSPAPQCPSQQQEATKDKADRTEQTRRPGIDVSVYDFQAADDVHPKPNKPAKKPRKPREKKAETAEQDKPTKKPRKRAANGSATAEAPAKKPKKRLSKSESFILNSDEPDDALVEVHAAAVQDATSASRRKAATEDAALTPAVSGSSSRCNKASEASPGLANTGEVQVPQRVEGSKFNVNNDDAQFQAASTMPGTTTLESVQQKDSGHGTSCKPPDTIADSRSGKAPESLATDSNPAQVSLPSLISGFVYTGSHSRTASHVRSVTGEALTKRRRLDVVDSVTIRPVDLTVADLPPAEPAKKAKAPKKKPQTITALATKVYQAQADVEAAQPVISAFFVPQAAQNTPSEDQEIKAADPKPKNSRKPRMKRLDADGAPIKPAKAPKTKKGKGRANEAEYVAPLYPPEKARSEEKSQDFLFGTSSQLMAEESLDFVREMQAALLESEVMPLSQTGLSSRTKSRIKVASAPNGTNLSIGQADRDLWCTAARDHGGDVMATEKRPSADILGAFGSLPRTDATEQPVALATPEELPQELVDESAMPTVNSAGHTLQSFQRPPSPSHDRRERVIVDLSLASPASGNDRVLLDDQLQVKNSTFAEADDPTDPVPNPSSSDNSWMLLKSDGSTPLEPSTPEETVPVRVELPTHSASKVPLLKRSATSPIQHRSALQKLDANISLMAKISPFKDAHIQQQRRINTSASITSTTPTRGRPRKQSSTTAGQVPRSPETRILAKKVVPPPSVVHSVATGSASQPAVSSTWLNIDEISDSDSPVTPSPPRRCADSSPSAVPPLDFGLAESLETNNNSTAVTRCTIKSDDLTWPEIAKDLFPRITAMVRSTPPSTEINNPTWHEKILLYDPIVLEDLTSWLNERNVKYEFRRLKLKPKKKGRKPKVAGSEEPEFETSLEDLKPWMVQKWCEENSICCLWKEGLRGGVRTRY